MNIITQIKPYIYEVKACWRMPAKGDYVPYREVLFLSLGWLGMRFATSFAVTFSVGNAFTGMTMHIDNDNLLLFSYISTAIGYLLAPLNAYIIDNLNSRSGKYRVYARLGIPSAILTLITLFLPYEKMSYFSLVLTLFIAGQIQGYVQNWFSTGVSNLIYVISPNSEERTKIMMVTSLVHNFAPSLTGLMIPFLSDILADGDLYNLNTYRKIYPFIIVLGAGLSLFAYYGTKERIVLPRSRVNNIGFFDALKAVLHNRIFWVRSLDAWNDFLENTKWNLLEWIFYYGKRGSMTLYGVINTFSFSSATVAMLLSPMLIKKFGKKNLKIWRNIMQTAVIVMLFFTYKKSLIAVTALLWIDRFCGTDEVLERSIEADMRDYQQYISGDRIDGAFGMLTSYINGAVGALTNLFLPWVYKRNGFDGKDYSVLEVFDKNGNKKANVLYSLLDKMLLIAAVGAAIDIIPWLFYNISETGQKGIMRVIRIRAACEDIPQGVCSDETYLAAYEALLSADKYYTKAAESIDKTEIKNAKKITDKLQRKEAVRAAKAAYENAVNSNEETEIAAFVKNELNRFNTQTGKAQLEVCRLIASYGENNFYTAYSNAIEAAHAIPKVNSREEKNIKRDTLSAVKELKRSKKYVDKYYKNGIKHFNIPAYEALFELPEDTAEQKKEKNRLIKESAKLRKIYGRTMRPYLFAVRIITLAESYNNIYSLFDSYSEIKERTEQNEKLKREAQIKAAEERREEINNRIKSKKG